MERKKWRGRRGRTLKRDTPVKSSLGRRQKRWRLPASKVCEAIPEELEAEESIAPTVRRTSHVRSVCPVHCEPVLRLNSPARTEHSRNPADAPPTKESAYQGSPAGPFIIQMTPNSNASSRGDQNLTETAEKVTSSSIESDTVFSSDAVGGDCYSSSSLSSCSLPSPEIFRGEKFVKTVTFSPEEEPVGLHPNSKNSTLLDVSWARNVHVYRQPNLSTIIDASVILAEICESSNNRGPEAETKIQTGSFKSDKASECKTSAKLVKKRSISYKKKVLYQNPNIKVMEIKQSGGPVQTSSPAEQMKRKAETFSVGEMPSKDAALHLNRPVRSSPENIKFFDFNDGERDVYFQTMRQRSFKLRNNLFFPLTAAEHAASSVQ